MYEDMGVIEVISRSRYGSRGQEYLRPWGVSITILLCLHSVGLSTATGTGTRVGVMRVMRSGRDGATLS